MRRTFLLMIALVFFAAFDADAQSKTDKNLTQELQRLQRLQDEAEGKKDFAALDRFFNDDFVFIAADGKIYDKKTFLDELKADTEPALPQQTLDYEDFTARGYGKTAIVNYVLVVKGKDKGGKDYTNRYRMLVIWVKQNGRWRIANFHSTRVRT
jgi:ketosteroid isomerase-like protein